MLSIILISPYKSAPVPANLLKLRFSQNPSPIYIPQCRGQNGESVLPDRIRHFSTKYLNENRVNKRPREERTKKKYESLESATQKRPKFRFERATFISPADRLPNLTSKLHASRMRDQTPADWFPTLTLELYASRMRDQTPADWFPNLTSKLHVSLPRACVTRHQLIGSLT